MSADKTLQDRLEALGAKDERYEAGARLLGDLPTADALAAILDEIDTAVLPSRLTFARNDAVLEVLTSGRRVASVVASSHAPDLAGKALAPEQAGALALAINALAEATGGALRVTAVQEDQSATPGAETGVTAGALRRALAQVSGGAGNPAPANLETFLSSAKDSILAVLVLQGGEEVQASGDAALCDALRNAAGLRLADADQREAPALTCLNGTLTAGTGTGIACFDTGTALFAYADAALATLHQSWRT